MVAGSTFAIIAIVGAVVAAASTAMAAKAQADAQRFQAKLAERQAETERQIAERKAEDQRRKTSALIASQRALFAGSGIDPGEGTPLLVTSDTAREGKLGELDILFGGENRASDLHATANLRKSQARNTEIAGAIKAGSTLLTGVGSAGAGGFGQGSLGTSVGVGANLAQNAAG